MNRTILTLSAASVAALSVLPSHLRADGQAGAEHWDGFIEMNGEKTPIHLLFEVGAGDTIRGQIATSEQSPQALENVAIVGNTLYFNIKDLPGNPTFKGTISSDGLTVQGTYSQDGDHHTFEVKYVEAPQATQPETPKSEAAKPEAPKADELPGGAIAPLAPKVAEPPAAAGERWNGAIAIPGHALAVELAFRNNPDGTISGQISIPEQAVKDHALSTFTIEGSDLSFSIPGIPGDPKFVGRIGEDGRTLSGDFLQSGQKVPFSLTFVDDGKAPTVAAADAGEPLPLAAPAASSAPVVGTDRWEGVIDLPGERLAVQVDFFAHSDERITGDVSVPSQNSFDLPLTDVVITGNDVNFGIADVPGEPRFSGMIGPDGSTLTGSFAHHGATFPFSLSYVKPGQLAAAPLGNVVPAAPEMATTGIATPAAPAAPVAAPQVANPNAAKPERWEGAIEIPGQRLEVQLDFANATDGTITGDITIPAQNATDLPLSNISIDGNDLVASIKGIPGDPTFRGHIQTDLVTITGEFEQNGMKFPFTLRYVESPGQASKAALDGFATWADKARQDWNAPGLAIAIVKDGQVILSQGLGTKDLESGGGAVTPNTLFAIGSCTKAFTTFVLGQLVDEGKLDWDKPVRDYIPTFKMNDERSTEHLSVRDMVTHRSGLPRHDLMWYNSNLSRADMVSRLAYLQPNKELRQTWQYNNLMFLTAGYVAEQITGKSWEDNVRERIFLPLGMTGADFSVTEMQKSPDFAYPYQRRDEKMRKMPFRNISQVGPAGSINAGVAEMANWAIAHLNNGRFNGQQIISPVTLDEMHRPQMVMPAPSTEPEIINVGYAMGWFVSAYRGHLMVEHGGNIDGFSALVTLLPNEKIGVVALTNMDGSPLPRLTTFHALDRLLGAEPKDWNAAALAKNALSEKTEKDAKANKNLARKMGTSPSHPLADYVGEYEHPGYGVLSVTMNGDQLAFSYNNISAPLNHWHYDTFVGGVNPADPALEDHQIQFRTNLAGEIDAIETAMDPQVKPIAFERKPDANLSDTTYLARFVGEYQLGPQVITISLKGNTLMAVMQGQPPYELAPRRGDTFDFKALSGFSIKFVSDAGGVQSAQIMQPNGVFTATRK